jgi:hypothetical protein
MADKKRSIAVAGIVKLPGTQLGPEENLNYYAFTKFERLFEHDRSTNESRGGAMTARSESAKRFIMRHRVTLRDWPW